MTTADEAAQVAAGAIIEAAAAYIDGEVRDLLFALAKTIQGRPTRHVIEFSETGWVLQHPIVGCGLDLFRCPVNRACDDEIDGPPREGLGRYAIELGELDRLVLGERVEAAS